MKILPLAAVITILQFSAKADLTIADSPGKGDLVLADGKTMTAIFVETNPKNVMQNFIFIITIF